MSLLHSRISTFANHVCQEEAAKLTPESDCWAVMSYDIAMNTMHDRQVIRQCGINQVKVTHKDKLSKSVKTRTATNCGRI